MGVAKAFGARTDDGQFCSVVGVPQESHRKQLETLRQHLGSKGFLSAFALRQENACAVPNKGAED